MSFWGKLAKILGITFMATGGTIAVGSAVMLGLGTNLTYEYEHSIDSSNLSLSADYTPISVSSSTSYVQGYKEVAPSSEYDVVLKVSSNSENNNSSAYTITLPATISTSLWGSSTPTYTPASSDVTMSGDTITINTQAQGKAGKYDITVEWTPSATGGPRAATTNSSGQGTGASGGSGNTSAQPSAPSKQTVKYHVNVDVVNNVTKEKVEQGVGSMNWTKISINGSKWVDNGNGKAFSSYSKFVSYVKERKDYLLKQNPKADVSMQNRVILANDLMIAGAVLFSFFSLLLIAGIVLFVLNITAFKNR